MNMSDFNDRTVIRPSGDWFAITPSNTTTFSATRGIYVGGDGNLHALSETNDEVTFVGMKGGAVYPLRIIKVFEDSTTLNLIGLM